MKRTKFFLLSAATLLLLAPLASAQTLLQSFEMTDGTGWQYSSFDGIGPPTPGGAFQAEFGYDYSDFGIPEAPNTEAGDQATSGLRMKVDTGLGGEQVIAFFEDSQFTGQYTLQVDIWANWASNGGSGLGTTEHPGVYVGFDPNDIDPFVAPAQNGAGLTFSTDGDCSNCDFILNKDVAELDLFSGQYEEDGFLPNFINQPGYDNTDNNANVNIPNLFPSFDIGSAVGNNPNNGTGTQPAGALGFQWVTVTAEVDTNAIGNGTNGTPGLATFTVQSARNGNSLKIGTVDNSVDDNLDDDGDGIDCGGGNDICTGEAPVNMAGSIGLFLVDFFNGRPSPNELGFTIYDNVRVFDGFLGNTVDGDFNDDSVYDCADIDALVVEIAGGSNDPAFDLNGDGSVDNGDRDAWLAEAGEVNLGPGKVYLLGDADLNGSVDGADFIEWNANKFTTTAAWCSGDFDANGSVDGADFIEWNNNKFQSSDVNSVPEPTAISMLGLALLCLIRRRK